jgi:hypothetical protein
MENINDIKVSLATSSKTRYANGNIIVKLSLHDPAFAEGYENSYSCYIFAEDFYPMCNSLESCAQFDFEWPALTYVLSSSHIWMPGNMLCIYATRMMC